MVCGLLNECFIFRILEFINNLFRYYFNGIVLYDRESEF